MLPLLKCMSTTEIKDKNIYYTNLRVGCFQIKNSTKSKLRKS